MNNYHGTEKPKVKDLNSTLGLNSDPHCAINFAKENLRTILFRPSQILLE